MLAPSQALLNSDTESTGLLKPDAISLSSSSSDRSNVVSDPLELERQLAKEVILHEKSAVSEQATDGSRASTISYEKALERELEYQKRMKMTLLQHPIGSAFLPISSQAAATRGLDRSASPLQQPQFQHPAMQQRSDRRPPLQHPAVQQQQFDQPPPLQQQQLLHQRAPIQQQLLDRRPPVQHQQRQVLDRRPPFQQQQQQQQVLNQRPLVQQQLLSQPLQWNPPPHGFHIRPLQPHVSNPYWCKACKVNCSSPHNLSAHLRGKKHKANCEKIFQTKLSSSAAGSVAP